MVYVASLGFATYENYDYVFRLAEVWEIKTRANGIVEIIFSCTNARFKWMYYGFLFWVFAFSADKKFLYRSLYVPYILHGIYNYLAVYSPLNILIVLLMLGFSLYLHKELKTIQNKKKKELKKYENKF